VTKYRYQRVRDPLHDLIEFAPDEFEDTMWNVIQSRPFQRLRRVKQLGFSELVYPGATHTRFSHSIGVFHIARSLMGNIEKQLTSDKRYHGTRAKIALAAALVHDVGHGPFSHSFETVGKRLQLANLSHEAVSARLIKDSEISECLLKMGGGFADDVAKVIAADGPTDIYSSVVSSQFDADRLDYMRRDKLMTGTQHSEIDFTWLMANLKIGEAKYGVDEVEVGAIETLVLDSKARFAAETYVLGLFQLYPTVYFHKATRSAEKIFTELFLKVVKLIYDSKMSDTGLPSNHPICKFAMEPEIIDNFLGLDDSVIWGALQMFCDAKDTVVSSLARRLRDRKLLKAFDFRSAIREKNSKLEPEGEDRIVSIASRIVESWSKEKSGDIPRVIMDTARRSPYKKLGADSGPLGRMLIEDNNSLIDLSDISEVVAAAKVFKLDRAYYDTDDRDAKHEINSAVDAAIREEGKNAA
jgi:uncharacterized protein